ncbi:hypothetical protein DPMN_194289 [Dreissena polymorpha]|uniref:Uncharacterized protein n=1 Tax=Dreissena polymorpha TaxID=45954 RepID=A0A9D4BET5_DREPO|nr:hypothetical protein DPMN_194289 [Dreissena polymorpha]
MNPRFSGRRLRWRLYLRKWRSPVTQLPQRLQPRCPVCVDGHCEPCGQDNTAFHQSGTRGTDQLPA